MKTTIDINDALFEGAKRFAESRQVPFRRIVEQALQTYLRAHREAAQPPFRLRRHVFRGQGLQPGIHEGDWAAVREWIYEGRGG